MPWLDCVLCASTIQYFNYIFDWIFILIPLLGGFYFGENILSDVHTCKCLALCFWEVTVYDGSYVPLSFLSHHKHA